MGGKAPGACPHPPEDGREPRLDEEKRRKKGERKNEEKKKNENEKTNVEGAAMDTVGASFNIKGP